MTLVLRRGDVVVVRLDPGEGSEIRKTRPAVVISNDEACGADAVVQVVPLTALRERPLRAYEALVSSAASGLERPSRAVANQLRSVARELVLEVLGRVTAAELRAVDHAVLVQLGLTR